MNSNGDPLQIELAARHQALLLVEANEGTKRLRAEAALSLNGARVTSVGNGEWLEANPAAARCIDCQSRHERHYAGEGISIGSQL
jgi:hypothetical protein